MRPSLRRRELLIAGLGLALGCGGRSSRGVTVFAAASLADLVREVAGAYTRASGMPVVTNLAGSQTLATQILEGAPADVFLSANAAQVARLRQAGRVEHAHVFATNSVVVATARGDLHTLSDLTREGVRVILAGPEVPAGHYAREALSQAGILDQVLANLVSSEASVGGVVSKLLLGEADAGVVYRTDLLQRGGRLHAIELPEVAVGYEAVVLSPARRTEAAAAFVAVLEDDVGIQALERLGFGVP